MNVWFDSLSQDFDVQVIKPGTALHAIVGRRTRFHVVKGFDDPRNFPSHKLRHAATEIRKALHVDRGRDSDVLVIDRLSEDTFHSGPDSETEMSGSRRRSVPNLTEVCRQLLPAGTYELVDAAHLSPREQIQVASNSRILIAQHGSGLVHMLWMPPGSTIIEIHPPLPDEAVDIFRNLAVALGHGYIRVDQPHVHAPVDPDKLGRALAHAEAGRR